MKHQRTKDAALLGGTQYIQPLCAMRTDSMIKRFLIFGLGTSLIQVIMFYFLVFIVYWFATAITIGYPERQGDPNEDYVMLFIAILFPVLVLIQNVVAAIVNNRSTTYVLVGIAIAAYVFGVIDMGISISIKLGISLLLGLVVLSIKTEIGKRIVKWFLE